MTPYAAFLRAVNVGGTGKLPMDDLRTLIAEIGGQDVSTYIASGNAMFRHAHSSTEVQARLAAALEAYAGKPVQVLIRTLPQLEALCSANPFADAEHNKVLALLVDAPVPKDPLQQAKHMTNEQIVPIPGALMIHYPSGMGRSKLRHPAMDIGTGRNLNTLNAVLKRLQTLA